jgi:hypothetical protein
VSPTVLELAGVCLGAVVILTAAGFLVHPDGRVLGIVIGATGTAAGSLAVLAYTLFYFWKGWDVDSIPNGPTAEAFVIGFGLSGAAIAAAIGVSARLRRYLRRSWPPGAPRLRAAPDGRTVLLALTFALGACGGGASRLPLVSAPPAEPAASSVFVGRATAFRSLHGVWTRVPGYDYDFTVVERRFPSRWDVVKEIHRRHPDYDGLAGPRDQTLHFEIAASSASDGGLDLAVRGTLGSGTGHEDRSGRLLLELRSASKGWFVPYDSIRIRQDRADADGRLAETVELFSTKRGTEIPFMRMEETGQLFRPVKSP